MVLGSLTEPRTNVRTRTSLTKDSLLTFRVVNPDFDSLTDLDEYQTVIQRVRDKAQIKALTIPHIPCEAISVSRDSNSEGAYLVEVSLRKDIPYQNGFQDMCDALESENYYVVKEVSR